MAIFNEEYLFNEQSKKNDYIEEDGMSLDEAFEVLGTFINENTAYQRHMMKKEGINSPKQFRHMVKDTLKKADPSKVADLKRFEYAATTPTSEIKRTLKNRYKYYVNGPSDEELDRDIYEAKQGARLAQGAINAYKHSKKKVAESTDMLKEACYTILEALGEFDED